jgi:hypothetical protein
VLGSLLIGVGAREPLTMTVSALVLTLVALLACYIPRVAPPAWIRSFLSGTIET